MHLLFAMIAFAALSTVAQAHQSLELIRAYAFETTPGIANGAAYIVLENAGPSDAELVGVTSDLAEYTQIHTHIQDGDLRRMVALELPLTLESRETLKMEPGGMHVMFLGLKEPFKIGDKLPVTLLFEGRHVKNFDVLVEVHDLGMFEKLTEREEGEHHGSSSHGHNNH